LIEAARRDLVAGDPGSPRQAFHGVLWLQPGDGPNLHAGLLAWAERIVVSPDSVNMASEAAATGASVRIADPGLASGRHAAFLANLEQRGAAAPLDPTLLFSPTTVLHELPGVAAKVRERMGL
jgi:mitochondrial fission protein ELM1